jgi:hypothetical protein
MRTSTSLQFLSHGSKLFGVKCQDTKPHNTPLALYTTSLLHTTSLHTCSEKNDDNSNSGCTSASVRSSKYLYTGPPVGLLSSEAVQQVRQSHNRQSLPTGVADICSVHSLRDNKVQQVIHGARLLQLCKTAPFMGAWMLPCFDLLQILHRRIALESCQLLAQIFAILYRQPPT